MATIEMTNVDEQVYAALALRAAQDNRTVAQEAEAILRQFLGKPVKDPEAATEAVLAIAGTWEDSRTAEEIIADIYASRHSGTRSTRFDDVFD
jgi:plasmid stability protein